MSRLRFIVLLFGIVALYGATAFPAQSQMLFNPEAVSKEINSLEKAGLPITHMFFFNPLGLNKAASDRLRMYRVMTTEEWNKLTPEQQSQKMKELKKDNPNVYVCFPTGNIYSIPNERFITFLYKISDWPEDFLYDDEDYEFYRAREDRLRMPQPPKRELPGPHGSEGRNEGGNNNNQ